MNSTLARATHAILRIGTALLFIEHGFQKFGYLGGLGAPCESCSWAAVGNTAAGIGLTRLIVAGWIELIGGALLLAGFQTRAVAALLFLEMIVAFFVGPHFPKGGSPLQNGGEVPLLYAAVFLWLAAAGAGPLSVDELVKSRR
jgi:putative oxidoreductase